MKIILSIIAIQIVFTSCNSLKKENYKVVNAFFENEYIFNVETNKLSDFNIKSNDSIFLMKGATNNPFNIDSFGPINSDYSYGKNQGRIFWIDSLTTIDFDQININHIKSQFESKKHFFWKKINPSNKIIIPIESISKNISIYDNFNEKKVFELSKPAYFINKRVAVFRVFLKKVNGRALTGFIAIMKKENNKWTYIGNIVKIVGNE